MKKPLFLLSGLLVGLVLAACGPTTTSSPASSTSEEETTNSASSSSEEEQVGTPTEYPTFPDLETLADDTGYSVSFKAPQGWNDPHLWAWTNEGGANAYQGAAWPGRAMEQAGDDGWYQLTVPTRIDMIIIAANQDDSAKAIQSEGLTIEGKNVWFDGISEGTAQNEDGTSRTTYNLTALYEAPTGAPAAVPYVMDALFGVEVPNAWRTANVYGVDKDGKETLIPTELDSDGYMFMGYARADYVSYYVTDGGDNRSVDFTLRKNNGRNSWYAKVGEYLIEGKNEAGIIAYETKPLPASETYHLIVTVPEDWTAPYLWAWNDASGSTLFSAWPGEALTVNEDGTYSYDVLTTCDNVIISNSKNDDPTSDQRWQTKDVDADTGELIDTTKETVYGTVVDNGDGTFNLAITYEE